MRVFAIVGAIAKAGIATIARCLVSSTKTAWLAVAKVATKKAVHSA
jgi:hypothetical protein